MKAEMRKAIVAAILVPAALLSTAAAGIGMSDAKSNGAKKASSYEAILYEIESARCIAEELGLADVKVGEEPAEKPDASEQTVPAFQNDLYEENPEVKAAMEQYSPIDAEEYIADFEASLGRKLELKEKDKLLEAIEHYNELCKNRLADVTSNYINSVDINACKTNFDKAGAAFYDAQVRYDSAKADLAKAKADSDNAAAKAAAAQANYDNLSAQAAASAAELAANDGGYQQALAAMETAKAAYDDTNGRVAAYQAAVNAYNAANVKYYMNILNPEAQAEAQAEMDAAEAAKRDALGSYLFEGALNLANNANKSAYDNALSNYEAIASNYNVYKSKADSDAAAAQAALAELENAKSSESAAKQGLESANNDLSKANNDLGAAHAAYNEAKSLYEIALSADSKQDTSSANVTDDDIEDAEYKIIKIKTEIANGSSGEETDDAEENDILSALLDGKANSEREQLDATVNSLLAEPTIRALSGSKATYSDVCKSATDYIKTRMEKVNAERQNANTVSVTLIVCAVAEFIAAGVALISKKSLGALILAGIALAASIAGAVMCATKGVSNAFTFAVIAVSCVASVAAIAMLAPKTDEPKAEQAE